MTPIFLEAVAGGGGVARKNLSGNSLICECHLFFLPKSRISFSGLVPEVHYTALAMVSGGGGKSSGEGGAVGRGSGDGGGGVVLGKGE